MTLTQSACKDVDLLSGFTLENDPLAELLAEQRSALSWLGSLLVQKPLADKLLTIQYSGGRYQAVKSPQARLLHCPMVKRSCQGWPGLLSRATRSRCSVTAPGRSSIRRAAPHPLHWPTVCLKFSFFYLPIRQIAGTNVQKNPIWELNFKSTIITTI